MINKLRMIISKKRRKVQGQIMFVYILVNMFPVLIEVGAVDEHVLNCELSMVVALMT